MGLLYASINTVQFFPPLSHLDRWLHFADSNQFKHCPFRLSLPISASAPPPREVGDGRGSREGGRGKGGRGRVGRGGRWRGRGRDGGVREREWRDDDRVRGRDDEDGESEDDLGWLDGPDNDVEAEKFAQKVGPEVMM
ncbi:hypothetical protein Droror1_Dr00011126, partial [Drosera rotundifolia]